MTTQKVAELISLALTPATIILAIMVVYLWGPKAWKAIRRNEMTAVNWFIVGVAASFAGGAVDNLYWFAAWGASFLKLESKEWLFEHGVYSNIIFRQSAGIIAALCHVLSAKSAHDRVIRIAGFFCAAASIGTVILLWICT